MSVRDEGRVYCCPNGECGRSGEGRISMTYERHGWNWGKSTCQARDRTRARCIEEHGHP